MDKETADRDSFNLTPETMNVVRKIHELSPKQRLGIFLVAIPFLAAVSYVLIIIWIWVTRYPWTILGVSILFGMFLVGMQFLEEGSDE